MSDGELEIEVHVVSSVECNACLADNFDAHARALVAVVGNAENARTDVTKSIHSHGDAVDAAFAHDTSESLSHIGAPTGELPAPEVHGGKRARVRRLLHKAFKKDEAEAEAEGLAGDETSREAVETLKASKRHAWLESLVPGIEKLTVTFHAGNYVAIRDSNKPPGTVKVFESMPIYAR